MFLKRKSMNLFRYVSLAILVASVSACAGGEQTTSPGNGTDSSATNLEGKVAIDGSSTVFPITEAMAEEFQKANPKVRVTVGVSGTGGGFKKFCAGETDISNASRPIKDTEAEACASANIEYIELPVAFDAVSVVVHPENTWAECMTVDELKTMWEPEAQGKITTWKQVNSAFPDEEIALYGPGTDSGTFDYFTDAVKGEEGKSRGDFTASEDDNTLVQGVEGNKYAIGYFGYAYYEENKDKLKAVGIDDGDPSNGEGCVKPSSETVLDSTYQPLARPIFVYVRKEALERPEVKAFVDFYLAEENRQYVEEVGYFPLTEEIYSKAQTRIADGKTGSVFPGGSTVGVKLDEVL